MSLGGGARSCVAVKPDKDGFCRCARFGPPGTGQDFKTLCKRSGHRMRIGTTNLEGLNMAKGWSDPLAALFDPEMLRGSLAAFGGGAAGGVAYGLTLKYAPAVVTDKAWKRLGLAGLLGLVGGALGYRFGQKDVAKGFMGALGSEAATEALGLAGFSLKGLSALGAEDDADPEAALAMLNAATWSRLTFSST